MSARNSVIPKYLFLRKNFFEIGPLINLLVKFNFSNLSAILKQLSIYELDLLEIFSKAFFVLYLTLIIFNLLLFRVFLDISFSFIILKGNLIFNFLSCSSNIYYNKIRKENQINEEF